MNTRGLRPQQASKEERAYTRRHIKAKHLRYLNRWQVKLGLTNCSFALRAKPSTRDVPLASMQVIEGISNVYIVWLTPATLRTADWRDSIIHELLHCLFFEFRNTSQELPYPMEECIVSKVANLLSRK